MGGLGIRPLKTINEALLGMWLWWLGDEQEGFWKQILFAKYDVQGDGWDP